MKTPSFLFTVMPTLLALLVGVCHLLPLNIVNVARRGMGFEYLQPWRARSSGIRVLATSALAVGALIVLGLVDWHALLAAPFIIGALLSEGQHAGEFLLEERAMGGVGKPSRENIVVLSGQVLKAGAVVARVNKGVGRAAIPTVVGTGNGTMTQVYTGPEVQVGNYLVTCTAAVVNGGVFSVVDPAGKALPSLTLTPGAGGTTVYTSREVNFSIVDGSTDFVVNDVFTIAVSTTAPLVIGTGNGTISGLSLGPDAIPGNYRVENIEAIVNGGRFRVVAPDGDEVAVGSIVAGAGGTLVLANQRQLNLTITDGATDFIVGDAFNVAVFNQLVGGKVVAWDPTAVDGRDDAFGILFDNVDATLGDLPGVIIARDATVIKSALQWGATVTAAQKDSAYLDLANNRGIIAR